LAKADFEPVLSSKTLPISRSGPVLPGVPPLGYDVRDRCLVVNDVEPVSRRHRTSGAAPVVIADVLNASQQTGRGYVPPQNFTNKSVV